MSGLKPDPIGSLCRVKSNDIFGLLIYDFLFVFTVTYGLIQFLDFDLSR